MHIKQIYVRISTNLILIYVFNHSLSLDKITIPIHKKDIKHNNTIQPTVQLHCTKLVKPFTSDPTCYSRLWQPWNTIHLIHATIHETINHPNSSESQAIKLYPFLSLSLSFFNSPSPIRSTSSVNNRDNFLAIDGHRRLTR